MIEIHWNNIDRVIAGVSALAEAVNTAHLFHWAEEVGFAGETGIRDSILAGGQVRTKKGGPRYKSGKMFNSVGSRTVMGAGEAISNAGYGLGGTTPVWTEWQEGGTSRGIPPMHSMEEANKEMAEQVTPAGNRMVRNIRSEWNKI